MEDNFSKFLFEYNKLETSLNKISGAPVDANMKWYEDNYTDQKIKNKLYLCRILRNYIQHNEDYRDFVAINDNMINFLTKEYIVAFSKITKAKDIMTPLKKFTSKSLKDNALETISFITSKKITFLPILNDDLTLVGALTPINALENILDCTKKTTIKQLVDKKALTLPKDTVKFIKEDSLVEDVLEIFNSKNGKKEVEYLIVTDTGKSNGKVSGIITKNSIN